MRIFLIFFFSLFLFFSCSKKNQVVEPPPSTKNEAIKIYREALQSLKDAQYLIAKKKFDQSESLLLQTLSVILTPFMQNRFIFERPSKKHFTLTAHLVDFLMRPNFAVELFVLAPQNITVKASC